MPRYCTPAVPQALENDQLKRILQLQRVQVALPLCQHQRPARAVDPGWRAALHARPPLPLGAAPGLHPHLWSRGGGGQQLRRARAEWRVGPGLWLHDCHRGGLHVPVLEDGHVRGSTCSRGSGPGCAAPAHACAAVLHHGAQDLLRGPVLWLQRRVLLPLQRSAGGGGHVPGLPTTRQEAGGLVGAAHGAGPAHPGAHTRDGGGSSSKHSGGSSSSSNSRGNGSRGSGSSRQL
mmetsp:Transcript_28971/g.63901  ORF Transcript_28971/g.63901 Transcript_28971/m.63901 type:complete len:233 (+) Transcript_28971:631-1329(+)